LDVSELPKIEFLISCILKYHGEDIYWKLELKINSVIDFIVNLRNIKYVFELIRKENRI